MQKVAYYRTIDAKAMMDFVIEKTKFGYVMAGPIRSLMLPKVSWLGMGFGYQIVYEATLTLDLGEK